MRMREFFCGVIAGFSLFTIPPRNAITPCMTKDNHTTRLKRILYRSSNRGWKETDLLIGKFAERNLHSLNAQELDDFEALLDESDPDIFDWVTGKLAVPQKFDTGVMAKLKRFKLAASS
jgi:antitoxin CptB